MRLLLDTHVALWAIIDSPHLSPEARHTAAVETLPKLHADPFDRMLVAQSLAEPFRLLTHDPMVARYNDTIILI